MDTHGHESIAESSHILPIVLKHTFGGIAAQEDSTLRPTLLPKRLHNPRLSSQNLWNFVN